MRGRAAIDETSRRNTWANCSCDGGGGVGLQRQLRSGGGGGRRKQGHVGTLQVVGGSRLKRIVREMHAAQLRADDAVKCTEQYWQLDTAESSKISGDEAKSKKVQITVKNSASSCSCPASDKRSSRWTRAALAQSCMLMLGAAAAVIATRPCAVRASSNFLAAACNCSRAPRTAAVS